MSTTAATPQDHAWMKRAIELSRQCPPSDSAYSVGAVIVDQHGTELSHGYSRETDPKIHAEEAALTKLPDHDPRLATSTLYSTLEPCTQRQSRPKPCAQLIQESGIPRVVIAWREPHLFVDNCVGVEQLETHGAAVIETPALADEAKAINAHLHF